ncbi:ribonuclease PH [Bacillus thuringiensis]|nr:ribonuclease PH [Bacillus thuringiensis]
MIIINHYYTLIDKDYHCQHETHTFFYKKQKARQKDSFFSPRSS